MCGITGFHTRESAVADQLRHNIEQAVRSLTHRGPDDEGIWLGEGVGLAHRRLSILDLSPGGHQPMHSQSGRFAMIFNGEVYNFHDIRRELEARGLQFHTSSDSEVVLAAIEQWGVEDAVRRFIGMFAIAIWDKLDRRLMLIRDRLGVKPLYYGWDGKTLCFGSELKALRAYRHWQPEIDRTALAEYFQFGYINAPRSIYCQVFKLLPGHWLELKSGGEPVVRRYWSVLDVLDTPFSGSEDELAEQLETQMVDAFRLRMVSDVPVGVFLSGGIDSSLVTALLQKHHGNIHTFTIGFNEPKYNEAPHARQVAEYLGTNHTERILDVGEAKRILPEWAALYDEPFADSSGIPTYLVSKIAGEQVKVVLSADGGDELFSGYRAYASMLELLNKRERIPSPLRGAGATLLRLLPVDRIDSFPPLAALPAGLRTWVRNKVTLRARRARDYYFTDKGQGLFYETGVSLSHGNHHLAAILGHAPERVRELADAYPGTFAEQMCLWDLHNYLPGCILAKVDRATMAASIEGREPLLDHRLVEFAFRLPLDLRRGTLGPKHLLRKVLYKYVPRELVDRPKMGFGLPQSEWLRGDLAHLLDEYLDPQAIRNQGLLDPRGVEMVVRTFRAGDPDAAEMVWSLLTFHMWLRRWG